MVGIILYAFFAMYGGYTGYLLDYGYGARAFAMGSSYYGMSGDVISGAYNPASLGFLRENGVSITYSPLVFDETFTSLVFSKVVSGNLNYTVFMAGLNTPGFEGRDVNNLHTGTYWFVQYGGGVSVGRRLSDPIALGLKVKFLYSRIRTDIGAGFGADAGLYYVFSDFLRGGLVLKNIIPMSLSYLEEKERAPICVISGWDIRPTSFLHFTVDLGYSAFSGFQASFGGEGNFLDIFSLRGGINAREIAGGIGVSRDYRNYTLKLDYSYAMPRGISVFHDMQRFSLTFNFGGYRVYAVSEPSVLSITNENAVAKIRLHIKIPYRVSQWSLTIETSGGEFVRKFEGKNAPPLVLMWDARDVNGMIVPDGTYRYRLKVVDEYGNEYIKTGKLVKVRLAL